MVLTLQTLVESLIVAAETSHSGWADFQAVEVESRPPIYLRVPPGHAKNWRKHCHKYNACGERVYFVQDNWYSREYVPHYQKQHRDRRDEHRDDNRDDDHGKEKKDKKDKKDKDKGRDH